MNRYRLKHLELTVQVVDTYIEGEKELIATFPNMYHPMAVNYCVFLNLEYQLALDKKLSNNPPLA